MIVESKTVRLYVTTNGKKPYRDWVSRFNDQQTKGRIDARATDLVLGRFGKCKPVGGGVTELILDFGPGYRIYIGEVGHKIIILLCGGDKSTQKADIKKAKEYWEDYKQRAEKVRNSGWPN